MDLISMGAFTKLVKLTARAFYDDISTRGDNQRNSRGDNRAMGVVILDALTRRQWVREEDLAKDLKLSLRQLRCTLQDFEEKKLLMRYHRKETAKGVKKDAADGAADTHTEKIKQQTRSYCCLDYAQIYDVVRYRIHHMKKKLKDELDTRNAIQEFICRNCNKTYNALDAIRLVSQSMEDEYFHCEICNGEVRDVDGDDNARRCRREKAKQMLEKIEEQLKPLVDQINLVKDLPVPDFGTLQAWEARASASAAARCGAEDSGTTVPFLGDTEIEVTLIDKEDDSKSDITTNAPMKTLPPWMIKEGMCLTVEQRGEMKEAATKMDDNKSTVGGDEGNKYQSEYVKAYYEALSKRQQENQKSNNNVPSSDEGTSSDRQIGMKSKRGDEVEEEDEWEEAAPSGVDLNVGAEAPEEDGDDDDDVEWEQG